MTDNPTDGDVTTGKFQNWLAHALAAEAAMIAEYEDDLAELFGDSDD